MRRVTLRKSNVVCWNLSNALTRSHGRYKIAIDVVHSMAVHVAVDPVHLLTILDK